jgi:hypothetical protein
MLLEFTGFFGRMSRRSTNIIATTKYRANIPFSLFNITGKKQLHYLWCRISRVNVFAYLPIHGAQVRSVTDLIVVVCR